MSANFYNAGLTNPNCIDNDSLLIGLCLNLNSSDSDNFTDFLLLPESEVRWSMLLLTVFVFCGIMGNLLVCLAIATEKKLQNVTSYFLLSLAVADLLVSVLVMPMSIINEIYGYWPLGHILCNIWILTDVLLCTSSIIHMSVISLDRYIGIRSPLKTRNKSMKVVGLKIAFVWVLSFLISSPLLGLGIADEKNVLNKGNCAVTNGYFILYGSISAFFIPLVIMTITYTLTIHLLHKQAEQCRVSAGNENGPIIRRNTASKKKRKGQNGVVEKPENGEYDPLIDKEDDKPGKLTAKTSTSSSGSVDSQVPRLRGLVMKHSMKIKAATMMLQRRDALERRERENTVKTEQKAAKVLGIMFGLFVVCWGPFFSVNVAIPLCTTCDFDPNLLTAFLWLGYISSIVNPIVYTAFNRQFRQTFIRLLQCKYGENACWGSQKVDDEYPCCLSSSRKTQPYINEHAVSQNNLHNSVQADVSRRISEVSNGLESSSSSSTASVGTAVTVSVTDKAPSSKVSRGTKTAALTRMVEKQLSVNKLMVPAAAYNHKRQNSEKLRIRATHECILRETSC